MYDIIAGIIGVSVALILGIGLWRLSKQGLPKQP